MNNYDEMTPAYGRDYTKRQDILLDWQAGKDFVLETPFARQYVSFRDVPVHVGNLNVRYSKLRKVAVLYRKGGDVWGVR